MPTLSQLSECVFRLWLRSPGHVRDALCVLHRVLLSKVHVMTIVVLRGAIDDEESAGLVRRLRRMVSGAGATGAATKRVAFASRDRERPLVGQGAERAQ